MRRGRSEVGSSVAEAGATVGVAAALPPLAQLNDDPQGLTTTRAATSAQIATRIATMVRLTRRRRLIPPRRRKRRLLT